MRELAENELKEVQGGIAAAIIISIVVAGVDLINNLIDLYIYNKTGSVPSTPAIGDTGSSNTGSMSNLVNDATTIANAASKVH